MISNLKYPNDVTAIKLSNNIETHILDKYTKRNSNVDGDVRRICFSVVFN